MVRGCYNLIKQNTPQLSRGKAPDATIPGKCLAKKCCRKDFKSSQDMSVIETDNNAGSEYFY